RISGTARGRSPRPCAVDCQADRATSTCPAPTGRCTPSGSRSRSEDDVRHEAKLSTTEDTEDTEDPYFYSVSSVSSVVESLRWRGAARILGSLFILLLAAPASAQVQLPDGPGKEVVERLCSICHEAERAASVRLTREGWEGELGKMVDLGMKATGMKATD